MNASRSRRGARPTKLEHASVAELAAARAAGYEATQKRT